MYSNQIKLHLATKHDFSYIDELFNDKFTRITHVIHNDNQNNYVKRTLAIDINDKTHDLFIQICENLFDYQYKLPFLLPTIYIIDPKENVMPALITPYYEKRSLRDIIVKQSNDSYIDDFDEHKKMIFIYCLSLFLEKLHLNNKFHGKLKASNIIIDNNYYPFVSDLFLNELENEYEKEKTIDLMVSLAPEIISNSKYQLESDIYSFGIIVMQIFMQKINIFSNEKQEIPEIENEIIDYNFEDIIDIVPESIRSVILKCLLPAPENRPNASEIRSTIENIIARPQYQEN